MNNKPKSENKPGYMNAWNRKKANARRIAIQRREALENGGPEQLDVSALKKRLAERKTSSKTIVMVQHADGRQQYQDWPAMTDGEASQ